MSFLLDTNVVSEWTRQRPDAGVVRWLAEVDEDRVFISVVTLAELRHGVERMPVGARRDRLERWLTDDLVQRFEGRVAPVDTAIADSWGRIVARSQRAGRPVGVMDAFIAATAEERGLCLVTRNVADFEQLGLPILNPWAESA